MMEWFRAGTVWEPVSLIVLLLLLVSLLQGMRRGASGSARRLFFFVWDGVIMIVCLVLAGQIAGGLSPKAADWLSAHVEVPQRELGATSQAWYTFITSLRDFALLRYGILFLLSYLLLRLAASFLVPLLEMLFAARQRPGRHESMDRLPGGRAASRAAGAVFGTVHGAGRAFVFVAALFIYVSLAPNGLWSGTIQQSPLYMKASAVLEPVAGDMLTGRGPVLAEAVQAEFQNVLQRKYEIIDYNIPADIEQAALQITKDKSGEEEKARALYDWLGSRIAYDWDKADNYVDNGVWKEQTPEETFETRKGVCIDVARLYAVMARASGLEVKVVTGTGLDGNGGSGPHAWNEVKIGGENGSWIPLDATWASSGDWFNPDNFDKTHIRAV
ncbi:Transglutaminase-like superfamily protein [Paenibacillus catalpae]|uniref:Transglutaminase-like superfamily protein n=1 Tax=Paenibacillus catalpae TaxID=1045775 RepID=A0A1I1Y7D3_9BACL|nr:transglutaminase-like domain-containing protein [Paenibacillus catalpae]SFE14918.1 Transglutaminase-like superfamily protein [Paenibacillus catalpae]